jgi:hypothetical protein
MAMDSSCTIYVKTDLTSLYYVIFIEPLIVCPIKTLSFDSDQLTNNTINKVIEEKMNNSFVLLKNITLQPFGVKKILQI